MRGPSATSPLREPGIKGFTLLELVAVIAIIGILAGVFLNRVLYTMEQAEKVAMEQTVGIIRSALHLQMAGLITRQKMNEIPHLTEQNPMNWLIERPKEYAGEFFDPKIEEIPEGSWYYDLKDGCLVYLVNLGNHFAPQPGERKWIRYRATVEYGSAPQNPNEFSGVVFKAVNVFKWF